MTRLIFFIDRISGWVGRAFAWLILMMAFGMGYEVMVRYLFRAPTSWAFDMSYILYGTLFMMGGAYTLSRNGHVRGDFLYRLWSPRAQASIELVLYFLFFFPGILALIFAGWKYAGRSWRYLEVSTNSPAGIPIFHFKTVLVAAGVLLFMQGIAQVCRCILCIRNGAWLPHEEDVEELEDQLVKQVAAGHGEDAALMAGRIRGE
ncbi:TRAP transporter small permease subunit [Aminobacter sp. J44]|jgi:TRAP-type mannitol/chloroaromatic compound transport system permease small subunit|uniref:TRAP transporter small permease subunit n=1 Tax=Aminobacter sp. J44 TaxID=935262 RepID=UPI00119B6D45|nr:TRAP transporter small permease subunit [Aminobacter sp. J44]TWG63601.1 TRAP-type mannitol/chloroaromatic compound transport system permease small subunit [Aminobacter sp. J44]